MPSPACQRREAGALVSAIGFLAAVILFLLPLVPTMMGVKLAALAAACLFPTFALLRKDALRPGEPGSLP
jgi:hypothetical protein